MRATNALSLPLMCSAMAMQDALADGIMIRCSKVSTV